MNQLLIVTIFLPIAGAALLWFTADAGRAAVRAGALVTTIATLLLAAIVIRGFPGGEAAYAVTDLAWLSPEGGEIDIRFGLGLDGLGLWLFGLSALLMVTCVLVSWEAIQDRPAAFYGLLLLLETGLLGLFAARDIILFYVFFEFTLIPLFFLIGIWGSEERRHAAVKFFLYTFAGSVLTFLGLLSIVLWHQQATGTLTFSIPALQAAAERPPEWFQWCVFWALFAGFAIKVPLFPLHTWLPLAHVQAPTAGSVVLAGVLLKVGTYGFVRFNLALTPDASTAAMPWILGLAVAGILYGALVALAQSDIKRLIAYSSVSHLGFCMLGLFAFNKPGLSGGVLQMINHGLSTGGLFAIVGMLYERYHTRRIDQLGGLARRTPVLAFFMLVFTFASIGLPGLNGFSGEFLLLLGMFQRAWTTSPGDPLWLCLRAMAVLSVLGVVLGAWYMLWLVQRVFFGPLREPPHDPAAPPIRDLTMREVAALAPLVVFIVWIGLAPAHFLTPIQPTLDKVLSATSAPSSLSPLPSPLFQ